jgi:hypothetical protein
VACEEVAGQAMTDTERPAELLFWFGDGACTPCYARLAADVEVSIGRTNSERALGFSVRKGRKEVIDFVLDRDQVAELAAFLRLALPRLRKPLGRRRDDQESVEAFARELDQWKKVKPRAKGRGKL